MKEIWKPIEGTDGRYEVSNTGKVRSMNFKRTGKTQEIRTRKNNRGYVIIDMVFDGVRKTRLLHRIVAEAFIPNENNLPQVNHIDGYKENNTVANLEWCDGLYNMKHASEHGLLEGVREAARKNVAHLDKHRDAKKIPVVSIVMATGESKYHDSIFGAVNELGIPSTKEITAILRKGCGTSRGYTFVRATDFVPENITNIIESTKEYKKDARRQGSMKNAKKIIATRLADGKKFEYNSIADAAAAVGAFSSNISAILNGRGKTARGYAFEFDEGGDAHAKDD